MTKLSGKSALITGASGGIGAAIARRFADAGADLILHFNSDAKAAEATADHARAAGRKVHTVAANLRDADAAEQLFSAAEEHLGGLDILVNNAGVARFLPFGSMDEDAVALMFDINVKAVLRMMNAAATRLRDGGRIINIGSSTSEFPAAGLGVYAASKAAVKAITAAGAIELGKRAITVNTLLPGPTTPGMFDNAPDVEKQRAAGSTPLGRLGTADEIADVALFLATQDAGWITGQHIVANGGGTV